METPGLDVRRLAPALLHASGALELLRRLHSKGARILAYHRFRAESRATLERQLAHLRSRYRPASLAALGRMLAEGVEPPPHTAVFTVDDGYRDFYQYAYPLLRKYGIPATLFVPTGFIDGECWLWVDRLRYCLRDEAAARRANERLKQLTHAQREAKLAELEAATGVKVPQKVPPQFAPCTWDELREMARGGIEIGAHTVTHPILSQLADPARLRFEVLESKRRLEEQLQSPVLHFAYPNGGWRDFGADALGLARAMFQTAVTMEPGWNHADTDRHRLFRTAMQAHDPLETFAARLAGLHAATRNGAAA